MSNQQNNNAKSLYELGLEYEKHAELQQKFISNCRAEIKKAEESGDTEAVIELKSTLNKLYAIRRELKDTAAILKNYYRGDKNE